MCRQLVIEAKKRERGPSTPAKQEGATSGLHAVGQSILGLSPRIFLFSYKEFNATSLLNISWGSGN